MYSVQYLYNFFKIIETTAIDFKTPAEFANLASKEVLLKLIDNKEGNFRELAKLKINELLRYYESQSILIKPLNQKLQKFISLHEKEFKSDIKKKKETTYNNYIKEDDPLNFEVEINLASKITNGLRLIMSALHAIGKPLENIVDMLDATKLINEAERASIIDSMIQYVEEDNKK